MTENVNDSFGAYVWYDSPSVQFCVLLIIPEGEEDK